MSMQWIEYRWWSSKGSYPSISNPRSIRLPLSSLHYLLPLFLLTYAVRGDINLSDRLCDPPPGLGGRRSDVNINILPGFRQTWSIRGHHESSAMITGGKHRHHPKMPPWALYPSTKCTIDTVSLVLVLDCRTIFSPPTAQVDSQCTRPAVITKSSVYTHIQVQKLDNDVFYSSSQFFMSTYNFSSIILSTFVLIVTKFWWNIYIFSC